jgi:hypothetical protein
MQAGPAAPDSSRLPLWLRIPEMLELLSFDGQVYINDRENGHEVRIDTSELHGRSWDFARKSHEEDQGDTTPETASREDLAGWRERVVRHLLYETRACLDCAREARAIHFLWIERRCPSCFSSNIRVLESSISPPRPSFFRNEGDPMTLGMTMLPKELDDHEWGRSANADDVMLQWQSHVYSVSEDTNTSLAGHPPLFTLMLFAESMTMYQGEGEAIRHASSGDVALKYFQMTGDSAAGASALVHHMRALLLSKEGTERTLCLFRHGRTVMLLLDTYELAQVQRISGNLSVLDEAIQSARESISLRGEGATRQLSQSVLAGLLVHAGTDAAYSEAIEIYTALEETTPAPSLPSLRARKFEHQLKYSALLGRQAGPRYRQAAIDLIKEIFGRNTAKIGERWHWSLAAGQYAMRKRDFELAQILLESAVSFTLKDDPPQEDPAAMFDAAERFFDVFNSLATLYAGSNMAQESLALLETHRGAVLKAHGMNRDSRTKQWSELSKRREQAYFGGRSSLDLTPVVTLALEEELLARNGVTFGPFIEPYTLPGLEDALHSLLPGLGDIFISLSINHKVDYDKPLASAVIVLPREDRQFDYHSTVWKIERDWLEMLSSQKHTRLSSWREGRLSELLDTLRENVTDALGIDRGGTAGRTILSLPSAFSNVPLDVTFLPDSTDSGTAEKNPVLQIPSAGFASPLSLRERNPESERMLIIGYEGEDIPHAGEEAKFIRDLFGPDRCTYLPGRECTKLATLQEMCGEYDFIHIIGHGTYRDLDPMGSSLEFRRGASDGYMVRAKEIQTYVHFPRRPVITLSSCSTALTAASRSNTWDGIPGALLRAGCWAIIGARWPVRDEAAARMMRFFYERIARTDDSPLKCYSAMRNREREGGQLQDWACFGYLGNP